MVPCVMSVASHIVSIRSESGAVLSKYSANNIDFCDILLVVWAVDARSRVSGYQPQILSSPPAVRMPTIYPASLSL